MSKPKRPPADLIEAAQSGDRLLTLIALRDLLAERLQTTTSSRDIASMSRRLMQAIAEIEIIERNKKAAEEYGFNLQEFRKKNGLDKMALDRAFKLNKIEAEHENN